MIIRQDSGKTAQDGRAGSHRPPLIVTLCSASKRQRGPAASSLAAGPQASVAAQWMRRLSAKNADRVEATLLYKGSAFGLAGKAAKALGAELGVISAGLGYVKSNTVIPGYDLTVRKAESPGSVRRQVEGNFDPQLWWEAVSAGPFSSDFLDDVSGRPLILICLSRDYAEMVAADLERLAAVSPQLRIFGMSIAQHLPMSLRESTMPYDGRLDEIYRSGTRVDFAQRALLHYVEVVHPHAGASLELARQHVERLMSSVPARETIVKQERKGDDDLKELMRDQLLLNPRLSASGMLRWFRNEKGLSCEQGRCSKLFHEVASSFGA